MRARTAPLVYVLLAGLAVLWGITFVGIKELLDEVSPPTLTLLRFALADACLLILAAAVPAVRPRIRRGDLGRLAVIGLTGVPGYHLALNYGERHTSASVASLVVATAPVMVALLSAALLREAVPPARAAGIALALAGVGVLAVENRGGGGSTITGVLITLLAALSWAVYTIAAKPLTLRATPIQITVGGILAGSAGLLPLLRSSTFREAASLSGKGWLWLAMLGVGSSAIGYLIFNWGLAGMSATRVSVFLYVVPVVALLGAAAILDEPLGISVALAAALVIAGVALAQREPRDQPKNTSATE